MGYLAELRREREARRNPKPVEPQPKSDVELLEEWGKSIMEELGVLEVFRLYKERAPNNKDIFTSSTPRTQDGSYSETLFLSSYYLNNSRDYDVQISKWVTVTVLKDESFTIEGEKKRTIPRLEYQQNPDVVTDALGEAIKRPYVVKTNMRHTPTAPSSEGGGYGI